MSKGSAPAAPQESQYTKQLAQIAGQRWNDYQTRFQPNETAYRSAVEDLNSDHAYKGAMAKGISYAGNLAGNAAQQGALNVARGGSATGLMDASRAGANAMADATFGSYGSQRANYLKQAQGVAKLGVGQVDGSIGTYKAVSDDDQSRINSNYAQDQGFKIAVQNAQSSLLSELGKVGTMAGSSGKREKGAAAADTAATAVDAIPAGVASIDWDALGSLPSGIAGYTGSTW